LNSGLTIANFRWSEKIPEDWHLLHIWAKCELMKGELIFISLVDIPEEFLSLRDFIMFSMI